MLYKGCADVQVKDNYSILQSLVSLAITLTDIHYKVSLMVILNRYANYAHMPIINIVKKYDGTVKYSLRF